MLAGITLFGSGWGWLSLNNGKLVGIITEGDLFQIFLKVSSEEKELENRD